MQLIALSFENLMVKKVVLVSLACLLATGMFLQKSYAKAYERHFNLKTNYLTSRSLAIADTVPPSEVMDVINTVVNATNDFNIEAVANLYTPNAIIADDEPPYSWNGPTAGVQWVNAVEQACKENKITKLRASIGNVVVYQQNGDNIYVVIPVSYSGNQPAKRHFSARGVFNFVLREVNGKWIVKSQTWISKKGMLL